MIAVGRPFNFPLQPGKTWTVEYTEHNPDRSHTMEHFRTPYRVVGWEPVTVPAGTFNSLKIVADGDRSAELAPGIASVAARHIDASGTTGLRQTVITRPKAASGRTYHVLWYVPSIKRWVKSEDDSYSSEGVQSSSQRSELVSDKIVP